jgi:hypothetical protein
METQPKNLKLARLLLTIPTVLYGLVPIIVDISPTHVFHPQWTPHARFHMVWLVATNAALAIVALYLLWAKGDDRIFRAKLAGFLGACVFGGFFVAVATHPLYQGALSDVGGVPPVMGVDANLFFFTPLTICLLIGLIMSFNLKRPAMASATSS